VNIICQSTINCQGEIIGIFTLMIPEIANQMVKISSTLKTCDMSDDPPLPLVAGIYEELANLFCSSHSSISA